MHFTDIDNISFCQDLGRHLGLQVCPCRGLLLPLPSHSTTGVLERAWSCFWSISYTLKSREVLQKEDQVTVFDRSIYLFKCRLCRMVSVAAAGFDSSAARGAASPAPVSQDAYYRLVPRLSHLFPPPLKWEAMVIPLSQNT